jgi:hypothetical protein
MRVDACHLRGRVGAHTEGAATELVDQLEGFEAKLATGAGQQRFEVLEQRRHDQLETVSQRGIQQASPQLFDAAGLGRQDIGDVLGQQPSRRHERDPGNEKKNCIGRLQAA